MLHASFVDDMQRNTFSRWSCAFATFVFESRVEAEAALTVSSRFVPDSPGSSTSANGTNRQAKCFAPVPHLGEQSSVTLPSLRNIPVRAILRCAFRLDGHRLHLSDRMVTLTIVW